MLLQLKYYLTSHDFISNCQSTFTKHHSTTTAVHKVISDILDGFDENEMCLIDLQKCIDIIDHTISLEKLKMV